MTSWKKFLVKLIFQKAFTKFRDVYGNRRFVTAVTTDHHYAVSLMKWTNSI